AAPLARFATTPRRWSRARFSFGLLVPNLLDNSRQPLQAGSAGIGAVTLPRNGMPQHAGRVCLRDCGSLQPLGDAVPEGVEAQALALHPERNELLAEQLTEPSPDLSPLGGTALQSGEEQSVLRQRLAVVEEARTDEFAVNGNGARTAIVLQVMSIVAIVNI